MTIPDKSLSTTPSVQPLFVEREFVVLGHRTVCQPLHRQGGSLPSRNDGKERGTCANAIKTQSQKPSQNQTASWSHP